MIKFQRDIIEIGGSLAITIPVKVVKELDLKEGDVTFISLSKEREYKAYKCVKCDSKFTSNVVEDIELYCPNCGEDNIVRDEVE